MKPARDDWTVAQDWAAYTPAQHAVWQTLFERQRQLLQGRACDAFIQGIEALPISALRIYGAGIASSASETVFALEDESPRRLRFELERVMRTNYRIDDFQESYFVVDHLDALLALARIDFAPVYQRAQGAELELADRLASDTVISAGTGRWHAGKRGGQAA